MAQSAKSVAEHLPFVRRFARALTGSGSGGDMLIKHVIDLIASDTAYFPRGEDMRVGLLRLTYQAAKENGRFFDHSDGSANALDAKLAMMDLPGRAALLLATLERLPAQQIAPILAVSQASVQSLIDDGLRFLQEHARTTVLVIEDEPIVALDIATCVRDLGHNVVAIASSRQEAVEEFDRHRPAIVLADIQLSDGYTGIDAVNDILAIQTASIIFVTAFPERLLAASRPEPSFLITKPFQRQTIKQAIQYAVIHQWPAESALEDSALAPADSSVSSGTKVARQARSTISRSALRQRPAPIHAVVRDQRIELASATPAVPTIGRQAAIRMKTHHAQTASRIARTLAGHNGCEGMEARLLQLQAILGEPVSEEMALAVGISSDGLERMLGPLRDRMLDLPFSDLEILITDIRDFAFQFAAYQVFRNEAANAREMGQREKQALHQLANDVSVQPDSVIAPALKYEFQNVMDVDSGKEADFAKVRSLGNILRALGAYMKSYAQGSADEINKRAVQVTGLAFVSASGLAALSVLSKFYPSELTDIYTIMKAIANLAK